MGKSQRHFIAISALFFSSENFLGGVPGRSIAFLAPAEPGGSDRPRV